MDILITNDDGISAPGLIALHEIATQVANGGRVVTVAPAYEQSGVGHCITYTKPLAVTDIGGDRFAVDGSPADCVISGVFDVMDGKMPDLILSGVNRGNNAAQNTLYSGTIGATIEAAMHDVPAIAMSQFIGPANKNLDDLFEASRQFGAETVHKILDADIWHENGARIFYNVNFPPVPGAEVAGFKVTSQGFREGSPFSTVRQLAPNGRDMTWIMGAPQHKSTAPGTDVHANLEGYISITPCHLDLTAHSLMDDLTKAFE